MRQSLDRGGLFMTTSTLRKNITELITVDNLLSTQFSSFKDDNYNIEIRHNLKLTHDSLRKSIRILQRKLLKSVST